MSTVSGTASSGSGVYGTGNNTDSSTKSPSTTTGTDALASSQTFMTLLVAQLKNQDPTQPADGMQFVTQLAQFSNLEQSVAMRQDIGSIKDKYVATTAPSSATGA